MRGNLRKMMTRIVSFLFLSQTIFFSLVRAAGTKNNAVTVESFAVDLICIIMAGTMIASGVLFVVTKIKMNKKI